MNGVNGERPREGDSPGGDLFERLYTELRGAAVGILGGGAQTLQPTALVHEAWLRLGRDAGERTPADRLHFLALASKAMRSALVDQARRRLARKRGGDRLRVSMTVALEESAEEPLDVLALHDALERLAVEEPRQARIVELRFFGGLDFEEVATAVDASRATVFREWRLARMWLRSEMG